jgi:TRAP-type C4-dicarboxylate transport system permease small subunit
LLDAYKRLLDAIGAVERILGVALIALIVITITFQVITRYAFNYPIIWVEETATYAFIWGTFVGASLGLKKNRHIKIETFVMMLDARKAALARFVGFFFIALLMVILIKNGWIVMMMENRSYSIALPIPIPRMWFYSGPLVISAASMLLTCIYVMLVEIEIATGRRAAPSVGRGA